MLNKCLKELVEEKCTKCFSYISSSIRLNWNYRKAAKNEQSKVVCAIIHSNKMVEALETSIYLAIRSISSNCLHTKSSRTKIIGLFSNGQY